MDEGAQVRIYEYEVFDKATRSWKLASLRGTLEAIAAVGGVAVRSSVLIVDRSRLDDEGFLVRTGFTA